MKKILLAVLLIGFTSATAQVTFEKGYFIANDGSRTTCLIKNEEWRNNPTSFLYRMDESGEIKTQNIQGVKEFGIDNESQYKRFTVKLERSINEAKSFSQNRNPEWKTETVLLQTLVSGQANLYLYTDSAVTKYFYDTPAVPVEQLIYLKYLNSNDYIVENKMFTQQLHNNVRCANTPDKSFEKMGYNRKSLVKHFTAYNSCFGSAAEKTVDYTAKDKERDQFVLRITPAVFQTKLEVNDPGTFYNMDTSFDATVFRFGLDLEYIFPFGKNRWSFFVNPGYQSFKGENTVVRQENHSNGGNPIIYNEEMNFSTIELPFGIRRYFFISPNSKIFANVGFMFETTLGDPAVEYTNTQNLSNATHTLPLQSSNSLFLGLGYAYKRFSGEFRYNTTRNVARLENWEADYSTYGLMLGYKIF